MAPKVSGRPTFGILFSLFCFGNFSFSFAFFFLYNDEPKNINSVSYYIQKFYNSISYLSKKKQTNKLKENKKKNKNNKKSFFLYEIFVFRILLN